VALAALAAAIAAQPALAAAGKTWLPELKRAGAVIWAVGDGATGGVDGRAVGSLVSAGDPDHFIYLGDVYDSGTAEEFAKNYGPLFGPLDSLAAPVFGNHEWANRALGYVPYWVSARGRKPPSWYSLKVSGWQLLGLNTVERHDADSPQARWLRSKLRRSKRLGNCRIAFMHHPRFSASLHGDTDDVGPLWQLLAGRARLALAGHDHSYQRFGPVGGLIQVVSGAGGASLYPVDPDARLAAAVDDRFGAVRIVLRSRIARLQFVAVGGAVLDEKKLRCKRRA